MWKKTDGLTPLENIVAIIKSLKIQLLNSWKSAVYFSMVSAAEKNLFDFKQGLLNKDIGYLTEVFM